MRSLRHKIALILGVSSLFTLLAGMGLSSYQYQRQMRRQSAQELTALSSVIPTRLDEKGAELLRLLKITSFGAEIAEYIEPLKENSLTTRIQQNLSAELLDFIEVTNSQGTIIWNLKDPTCLGKPCDNPLITLGLQKGEFGYGVHQHHGNLFILATSPIIYGQRVVGTVSIGQRIDRKLLAAMEAEPDVHLAIWNDPNKDALAATGRQPLPAVGYILGQREQDRLLNGEIIYQRYHLNGQYFHGAFFTQNELTAGRQTYCAVYRSLEFLTQANRIMLQQLLVMSLIVLVFTSWFALWISRRVTDPVAKLTKTARRLAIFDFSEPVPVSTEDEIGDLAHSISFLSRALQENMVKKDQYASELAGLNVNLERQVAQRTEALVHANNRLEHEMAEKEDFLRAISHDLGAPLRNIAGLARLLERRLRKTLSDEGLEMLGRISNNVKNELSMIEMLLELSRIKTRRTKSTCVDLNQLLHQIREDLYCSIEEKQIKITVQEGLPVVWAEENRIRQLFQNLIDNAIKYMGDQSQPELVVGWSEHPNSIMFWVSDNGIGIPKDQQSKIFGVFRRVRSRETGNIEGKGVGLASVKTIVEMYGGEIWVESELGQGSTFYFTLNKDHLETKPPREAVVETEDSLVISV